MGLSATCDKCKKELGEILWYSKKNGYDIEIDAPDIDTVNFVTCAKYTGHDPNYSHLVLCDKCYSGIISLD